MMQDSPLRPYKPVPEPDEEVAVSNLMETSSFVRQIVHERNFRIAAVFCVLAFLTICISLPKIWKTSPPGFTPEIRVSLLGRLEAAMLARSARRLDSEGKFADAILAWKQSISKDLGNIEHQRGLLGLLARQPSPDIQWLQLGVGQAFWLLRMTDGSRDDRIRCARFFDRYNLPEYVWLCLKPVQNNLNDNQAALFLKSCLQTRHFEEFGAVLKSNPKAIEGDPELPVYKAAWAAGWGPTSGVIQGKQELDRARKDPATAVVANRLQLMISEDELDLQTFTAAFNTLRELHADRPIDHVGYWQILNGAGQTETAKDLALKYSTAPRQANELRAMFNAFLMLGLRPYAAEFMKKHLPELGTERDLWAMQSRLLLQLQLWDDLRLLAIDLRTSRPELELVGYAWFLEGLVELHHHLPEQAAYSFSRIPDRPIGDPYLGYQVARQLILLGYPKIAEATLSNLEHAAGKTADYWYNVTIAALEDGQFENAAHAATKAYELRPDHPATQMNYAGVLLTLRTNPALAVQITLRQLKQTPEDPGALLNHVLALLQNQRLSEAEAFLHQIPESALDARNATTFALAWFELRYRQERVSDALEVYGQIQHRFLQPPQSNWVESAHRDLLAARKKRGG